MKNFKEFINEERIIMKPSDNMLDDVAEITPRELSKELLDIFTNWKTGNNYPMIIFVTDPKKLEEVSTVALNKCIQYKI